MCAAGTAPKGKKAFQVAQRMKEINVSGGNKT